MVSRAVPPQIVPTAPVDDVAAAEADDDVGPLRAVDDVADPGADDRRHLTLAAEDLAASLGRRRHRTHRQR